MIVVSVLVVFAIPVLFFSEHRQQAIESFVSGEQFVENKWLAASIITLLFSGDLVLPVPSSAVCTVAGKIFGVFVGTLLCWIGLNISSLIGYLAGWYLGWAAVTRFSDEEHASQVKGNIDRWGVWPILLLRPIPVVSEASILLLGTYRYPAVKFWPPILIANFVFAACFVGLGVWFSDRNFLIGIAISCIVPVLMLFGWSAIVRGKRKPG